MQQIHPVNTDPAYLSRVPLEKKPKNTNPVKIPKRIQYKRQIQRTVDWIFFPILAPIIIFILRHIRKNRIENHKKMRTLFKRIAGESDIPTLICANHLTKMDSIYIHHAFASIPYYWKHFRLFSWNIPAKENFWRNPLDRLVTYLGKCIPIVRTGSAQHHKEVLDTLRYLLHRGELCTVFPEGGRSETGRIEMENVRYGVGTILKGLSDYRVFCVYMRGRSQEGMTDMPPRGDSIYFDFKVITPQSIQKGRRAERDIARTIIEKLKEMENEYFAQKIN
jgi:1-acyl-sn-glycerol-3-phosphate acyltransferase